MRSGVDPAILRLSVLAAIVLAPTALSAQEMSREAMVRSAESAGPSSISDDATIVEFANNDRLPSGGCTCPTASMP